MLVGERSVCTDTIPVTAACINRSTIPPELAVFCTDVVSLHDGPVHIDDRERRHITSRILAYDIIHLVNESADTANMCVAQYEIAQESGRHTIQRLPHGGEYILQATYGDGHIPFICSSSLHALPDSHHPQEIILDQDEIDLVYEMLPHIGFLCALGEQGRSFLTEFFGQQKFCIQDYVGRDPRELGVTFQSSESDLSLSVINRKIGLHIVPDVIVESTGVLSLVQAQAANELHSCITAL